MFETKQYGVCPECQTTQAVTFIGFGQEGRREDVYDCDAYVLDLHSFGETNMPCSGSELSPQALVD